MKYIKYHSIFCFTLLLQILLLIPQSIRSQDSRATGSILTSAEGYYRTYNFARAAGYYQSYVQKNSKADAQIWLKLADCYWNMRKYDQALTTYEQIFSKGSSAAQDRDIIRIGELYARTGDYVKASQWLSRVPAYSGKAAGFSNVSTLETFKKDSLSWTLKLLNIDTQYREFSPCVIDNSLFFSSNKPLSSKTKAFGWDGYNFSRLWRIPLTGLDTLRGTVSYPENSKGVPSPTGSKADINFEYGDTKSRSGKDQFYVRSLYLNGDAEPIGSTVGGLEGVKFNAGSISVDRNNHIYFSANYDKADKNNINRIRMVEGVYENGSISYINALPFGDASSYSVMHPAINREGTLLVFASDVSTGKGGYDLYYSERDTKDGQWNAMKPLSTLVNTQGNEVFPYISEDNKLYFSSDALPGLGGLDIYSIPLQSALTGNVKPTHLSYPVNTPADDFGFYSVDNSKGYLTSDRLNDDDNIYSYSWREIKQGKYYLCGRVLDAYTGNPLEGVTVFGYDKSTGKVYVTKTKPDGGYCYGPLENGNLVFKAVAGNYTPDCTTARLNLKPLASDSTYRVRDLKLGALAIGSTFQTDNIHYDFDKWNIRKDAEPILDSVLAILNKYPIKVELGSHTDCRGTSAYNERLSQRRAESAVAYLVKQGISRERITAKGYGESQLLNRCSDGVTCSEAEHQANRRTEIKITGLTTPAPSIGITPDQYKDGQVITIKDLPDGFFEGCR
jgi:outer membrane protein OmpA-like peptidoglycan-associated protein/tetratricopeptide (TPR) repeat protein